MNSNVSPWTGSQEKKRFTNFQSVDSPRSIEFRKRISWLLYERGIIGYITSFSINYIYIFTTYNVQ